jgi:TrmH family RNA methyltransferase
MMPAEPSIIVSSRQNPRFKAALALRDGGERRKRGRMLVDGGREIGMALTAGVEVIEAWVAPDEIRTDGAHRALVALGAANAPIVEAQPELLRHLAYGDRSDGVVVVMAQPTTSLEHLALPDHPLIAVVDRVEKPGNLGAVMRSADGAGVDAVIATDPVSEPWNPNTIRASLGTIFSLPFAVASATDTLALLRERSVTIVTARVDGTAVYTEADLGSGTAIVVGSENAGLGADWDGADITPLHIPMLGSADSLNVSASAAILLYEARRQRSLR